MNAIIRDPVCGMEFDETEAAASVLWNGSTYWFCTDACKDDFQKDPERYEDEAVPAVLSPR